MPWVAPAADRIVRGDEKVVPGVVSVPLKAPAGPALGAVPLAPLCAAIVVPELKLSPENGIVVEPDVRLVAATVVDQFDPLASVFVWLICPTAVAELDEPACTVPNPTLD